MPGRLPVQPSPNRVDRLARQSFEGGVRGTSALPRPVPGPTRSQLNRPRVPGGFQVAGLAQISGPSFSGSDDYFAPFATVHGTTTILEDGNISITRGSDGFLEVNDPGTYALLLNFEFSSFSGFYGGGEIWPWSGTWGFEIATTGRHLPPADSLGARLNTLTLVCPPITLTTPSEGFYSYIFLGDGTSSDMAATGSLIRYG